MATKVITDCYKCEAETEAIKGQVHPLCEDCELEFDSWFSSQLTMFN
jgi:hypothetical protein